MHLSGDNPVAAVDQNGFRVSNSWSPLIGLEDAEGLTPWAFNDGVALTRVSMLVFVRRRILEVLPGQV